ncbi:hypothetical protein BC936DRAFT_144403 [Jimgerdemannia flammicorona]|uniref:Uncharacterized protein n=1 Tax=Jimgerdemannia flammicorona TaxID=994334 RepID=A0A433DCK4_9FUNG|nr:hypothetical protein BC936DRAFT_144403 [Jimgerdemannia flammicorona]
MARLSTLVVLLAVTLSATAQRPINYVSPTVPGEAATSQFGILGTVTAISDDPGNILKPNNATSATVTVLCSYTGVQAITASSITVHDFGTYNSYCAASVNVGFTGLFFLNATLLGGSPTTNTTETDFKLSNHCVSLFPANSYTLAAIKNVTGANPQGSQCDYTPSSTSTPSSTPSSMSTSASLANATSLPINNDTAPTTGAADSVSVNGAVFWSVMAAIASVTVALL